MTRFSLEFALIVAAALFVSPSEAFSIIPIPTTQTSRVSTSLNGFGKAFGDAFKKVLFHVHANVHESGCVVCHRGAAAPMVPVTNRRPAAVANELQDLANSYQLGSLAGSASASANLATEARVSVPTSSTPSFAASSIALWARATGPC